MNKFYCHDNLEDLHKALVTDLLFQYQFKSAPRGKTVYESLAQTVELTDPRNRLIRSVARKVNYGFAVGELCWYLNGAEDLETMQYYNRRMESFSDDGMTLRSAYGARIFNSVGDQPSQHEMVISELLKDPDSRRAVIHINAPDDLLTATTVGTKDVPCTLSLQFFIRNRMLELHTTMRSNDIIWGFPYDVFSFTSIQEVMLLLLKEQGAQVDDLGSYYHTAGSLHLYETHLEMAREIHREDQVDLGPMEPYTLGGFQTLLMATEPDIRTGIYDHSDTMHFSGPPFDWMGAQLWKHRMKRCKEISKGKTE